MSRGNAKSEVKVRVGSVDKVVEVVIRTHQAGKHAICDLAELVNHLRDTGAPWMTVERANGEVLVDLPEYALAEQTDATLAEMERPL